MANIDSEYFELLLFDLLYRRRGKYDEAEQIDWDWALFRFAAGNFGISQLSPHVCESKQASATDAMGEQISCVAVILH